ncbi:MAG TPA: hypothetical protein VHY30_07315 [Verrucomicrobiae bacterium]|jgi:hypothetical protein|nr:hypothetical protein [Verrucomicrobiae bacterium]
MPKKSPTQTVNLGHPAQYYHSCMANRFTIEREEGFTLAHFGLVSRVGLLLDRLTCLFPEHTLLSLKENLVQYSDKVGLPKKTIPAWSPPVWIDRDFSTLPVIDFVHLCHWDDAYAEICFWSYSRASAADIASVGKKDNFITPWGVALLRCEIDLQRAFLEKLYAP